MIDLTGTYDIECAGWDRFKVAATYDGHTARIHSTLDSLTDYLLDRGGTWWAHCGGQYDGLAVADEINRRQLPAQIDYPRSRITRLVRGRTILRDSFSLLPFSLENVAAMAKLPCPRMPWACTCPTFRKCLGYCQLATRPARDFHDYVIGDCRVLYNALCELVDFADTHKIDLRGTIGSTAWSTAQRHLKLPDAALPRGIWEQVGQADYGARQTLTRPVAPGPGTHRDITSAYPAALARVAVPVGEPEGRGAKDAARAFSQRLPGCYQAVVDVPPAFLPALPYRYADRISYPHGTLRGSWTLLELEAAEARGAKISAIRGAVTWPRARVLFASLVDDWYRIRARVGKYTPWGRWMRELANSLTGKFGEAPWKRTIRMNPRVDQIVTCHRVGPCRHGCTKACLAWEMIDKWGRMWAQPYYAPPKSGHLHWAAYLKAATRIAWLTEAERHGEALVAGNCDSIWTTSRIRSQPQGRALGAWETKNSWTEWEARSPSVYRYRDGHTGEVVIRASGAGLMTDAEWQAGRIDRARGVETLIAAAQKGGKLFRRKNQRWTLPGSDDVEWFGDRKLDASGCVTRPVDVAELHDRSTRVRVSA